MNRLALAMLVVVVPACGGAPCREPPTVIDLGGRTSPYVGYVSPHYRDAGNWLCRPDVDDDPCDGDLTATEIHPDGTTSVVPHVVAPDPALDCFYVYPTVTLALRAGIDADPAAAGTIAATALTLAARFSSVCRVFAPLYRQVTLTTYGERTATDVKERCFEIATTDVEDAFLHFLGTESVDRPFVVIGHSQGTHHLMDVIARYVDDDPALRARLVAALLIGGSVSVDDEGRAGGTFANLPLCASSDDTACVIAYRSLPEGGAPPDETPGAAALPSFTIDDGDRLACTSPRGGSEPLLLDAVFKKGGALLRGSPLPRVDTPWIRMNGLYRASCTSFGARGDHLVISLAENDARMDPVGLGDDAWQENLGLHILDVTLAQYDLVATVEARAAAWHAAPASSP